MCPFSAHDLTVALHAGPETSAEQRPLTGTGAEIGVICMSSVLQTASAVYWSKFLATERRCNVFPVRYELNLYVM
jgi:hypothetical protein